MNPADIEQFGLFDGKVIGLATKADDAIIREKHGLKVFAYDVPRGCIGAYYSECNVLIPLSHHAEESKVPAGKSVPVRIIQTTSMGTDAVGPRPGQSPDIPCKKTRSILALLPLWACNLPPHAAAMKRISESQMSQASLVQEHMDVISSDRKTVGKVDHLDGPDKIKLTKQSSPNGEHHHSIPVSWIDRVDQHVHLNKTGADVTAHWEHEGRV